MEPLSSVGVYAPGGYAPLASSVLMCAVPASVAGVERIAVATPPSGDGSVNPHILAACRVCGVSQVYRVGGAQAIAALAYGTEAILGVDKIVGPGNMFVNLAKMSVAGSVGIDMPAGPTEVVIISDSTARPDLVAADLLAQAEHAPMCPAAVVTTSRIVAEGIQEELRCQLGNMKESGFVRESLLSGLSAIIVVGTVREAIEIANELAPEHLELVVARPRAFVKYVRNAGAVFLGPYTPEAIGDYSAGPSHVLPTGGAARFCSGLSVYDFLRRFSVMEFSREALRGHAAIVRELARAEGMAEHLRSFEKRLED
jgi:histidinol dehydrogenase